MTNTVTNSSKKAIATAMPISDKGIVRGSIGLTVLSLVGFGFLYSLAGVGFGQVLFPDTAAGSLIEHDGVIVGSALVAQPFANDGYFQPRPSAAGYNPMALAGSNQARTNPDMRARVEAARAAVAQREGIAPSAVPGDLITQSGGGIDPHISPEGAQIQIDRIARARGLDRAVVKNWCCSTSRENSSVYSDSHASMCWNSIWRSIPSSARCPRRLTMALYEMEGLNTYLQVEDIVLDLQASDKRQVFKQIGHHFESTHALAAETVVAALLRREQLGSTAVGDGVAIPHARMQELDRIRALYIRLMPALAFDAPDDKPVCEVLVLLVPSPAEPLHLDILAQAASLFLRHEFRKALRRCETPSQVKDVFEQWAE